MRFEITSQTADLAPPFNLGLALMAPGMAVAEPFLSWTTGIDYSSGGYGSNMTTETWYLPLTARWNAADWQFKLTLPYVRMKAPSGGVIIGYDDNGLPIRDGVGTPVTQDGLGDVVASATYSRLERPDLMLDVTAKLKLGTASVSKGLGTGEHDYGLLLDAFVPLGKATPFFSLGYKRPGDPAGLKRLLLGGTVVVFISLLSRLVGNWNSSSDYLSASKFAPQFSVSAS